MSSATRTTMSAKGRIARLTSRIPDNGYDIDPRRWWMALGAAAVFSLVCAVAAGNTQLGVGLAIFFGLVILPLRFPIETVFLILATGWFPFERLFGWEKSLLSSVGGFNLSGLRLVGAFAGLTLAVIGYRSRLREITWPRWLLPAVGLYLALVAYSVFTIAWTPGKLDGVRAAAKLAFPLLIAGVVLTDPRRWGARRTTEYIFWLFGGTLLLATLFGFTGILPADEPGRIGEIWGWAGRASYAFYAAIVAVFAVAMLENRQIRHSIWVVLLALLQLPYTVSRIAIGAAGVAITWMIATTGVRRILAPLGILAVAGLFLFFPPLIERNTYDPATAQGIEGQSNTDRSVGAVENIAKNPTAAANNVRLEGREDLWRRAIDRMGPSDYIHGRGLNAYFNESVEKYNDPSAAQLHGEYVRLLHETGVIGLGLFLLTFGGLTAAFIRMAVTRPKRTLGRACASAAVGAICVYCLTATTDNTLDYYLIGAYVWALMALALLTAQTPDAIPEEAPGSPDPDAARSLTAA